MKVDAIDEEAAKMNVEEREIIDLTDDVYPPPSLPSHILPPREVPAPHLHQPAPPAPTIKSEEVPILFNATFSATNAIAGLSSIKLEDLPTADTKLMNYVDTLPEPTGILAEDESQMGLSALLECLRVDELRCIAKQMRVKASSKVRPRSPCHIQS